MGTKILDAIQLIISQDKEADAMKILMQSYADKSNAQQQQLFEALASLRAIQKINDSGGPGAKGFIDALTNCK